MTDHTTREQQLESAARAFAADASDKNRDALRTAAFHYASPGIDNLQGERLLMRKVVSGAVDMIHAAVFPKFAERGSDAYGRMREGVLQLLTLAAEGKLEPYPDVVIAINNPSGADALREVLRRPPD